MSRKETRKQLISATKALLMEPNPEKITARQIAKRASVSLAMINYCFGTKDRLLNTAIEELISDRYRDLTIAEDSSLPVKERLLQSMTQFIQGVIQYEGLIRIAIPYLLREAPKKLPERILPYLREYYGSTKTEKELRLIAFEMMSAAQFVFYKYDDFSEFTGYKANLKDFKEILTVHIDLYFHGADTSSDLESES